MGYTKELFENLEIKMYRDTEEISFRELDKMAMVWNEKKKSEARCRGYYKTSGERCRTRVSGYCKKHKEQDIIEEKRSMVEVEVEYIDVKKDGEHKKMVINNMVYDVYKDKVFKNDKYVGEYVDGGII